MWAFIEKWRSEETNLSFVPGLWRVDSYGGTGPVLCDSLEGWGGEGGGREGSG